MHISDAQDHIAWNLVKGCLAVALVLASLMFLTMAVEAAPVDIDVTHIKGEGDYDPEANPEYFYLFNRTTRQYTDVIQFNSDKEPYWVKMRAANRTIQTFLFVPKDWMLLKRDGIPYMTSAMNLTLENGTKKVKFDLGSWNFEDHGETISIWREVKTKDEALVENWTFSFIMGGPPKITWKVNDLDKKAQENRTLEWRLIFDEAMTSIKDKGATSANGTKLKEMDVLIDWSDFGMTDVSVEANAIDNEWVITFYDKGIDVNFTVDPSVSIAGNIPISSAATSYLQLAFTNPNNPVGGTEVIDFRWLEFYWFDTATPGVLWAIDANPCIVPSSITAYVRFYDMWGNQWQTAGFTTGAPGDTVYVTGNIPLCWLSVYYTSEGRQHDMFHTWQIRVSPAGTWQNIDEPVKDGSGGFPVVVDTGGLIDFDIQVPADAFINAISSFTVNGASLVGLRHYTIPLEVELKSEPIHVIVRIYDATTGEGIPWETYVVKLDTVVLGSDVFRTTTNQSHVILIEDYFGNSLYTDTITANNWDFPVHLWTCPVTMYSVKFFNQKPEFVHKMGIYYNKAGTPYEFYIAPLEVVELHLRAADYRIEWTPYKWYVAKATKQFDITISEANYFLINGTLIANITSTTEGIYSLTEIITTLMAPDLVVYYDQLPHCPAGEDLGVTYIHPYAITTVDITYNYTSKTCLLWSPTPDRPGRNYTIDSDILYFSGTYATEVYINWTGNSTERFHLTTLPATLELGDGDNYTLWASASIDITRKVTWREYDLFWWAYYNGYSRYEVTLSVNNTMNMTWRSVNWFIGWPEGRTVDIYGVKVYDVNNGITLAPGEHYDITMGGVYFYWSYLNASTIRTFKVTAWDYNATNIADMPLILMTAYASENFEGRQYFCQGTWGNDMTAPYQGPITIAFKFDADVDPKTILVWNVNTNSEIPISEWVATSTTLTLTGDALGTIAVGGTAHIKIYFNKGTQEGDVFLFSPLILGLSPWVFLVILSIGLSAVAYKTSGSRRENGNLWVMGAVCMWAMVGVMWILHDMGVIG